MSLFPFHLAIPTHDLAVARSFYGELLGCEEGRSDTNWVDFNLYGHQLVCHLSALPSPPTDDNKNAVDGHAVPIPHFGVVLEMEEWRALRDKLVIADIAFIIEPHIRFAGFSGRTGHPIFYDPSVTPLNLRRSKTSPPNFLRNRHRVILNRGVIMAHSANAGIASARLFRSIGLLW